MKEKELFKKAIDDNITNKNNLIRKINNECEENITMKFNYKNLFKGAACLASLALIIGVTSGFNLSGTSSKEGGSFILKAYASTDPISKNVQLKNNTNSENQSVYIIGSVESAGTIWSGIDSSPVFSIEGEDIEEIEYTSENGSFFAPYEINSTNDDTSLCSESNALNEFTTVKDDGGKTGTVLKNSKKVKAKHSKDIVAYFPSSIFDSGIINEVKEGLFDKVTVKVKFTNGTVATKTAEISIKKLSDTSKLETPDGIKPSPSDKAFFYEIEAKILD